MKRQEVQIIVTSGTIVVATVIATYAVTTSIPAEHSIAVVLIGQTLLFTVFTASFLAQQIDDIGQSATQLRPQTQIALWIAGVAAIILATDMLEWFDVHPAFMLIILILLTGRFRNGFRWLLQRMKQ